MNISNVNKAVPKSVIFAISRLRSDLRNAWLSRGSERNVIGSLAELIQWADMKLRGCALLRTAPPTWLIKASNDLLSFHNGAAKDGIFPDEVALIEIGAILEQDVKRPLE